MLLQGMRLQGVSLRACVVNGRTAAKGLRLQSVLRFKTNAALGNGFGRPHPRLSPQSFQSTHTHENTPLPGSQQLFASRPPQRTVPANRVDAPPKSLQTFPWLPIGIVSRAYPVSFPNTKFTNRYLAREFWLWFWSFQRCPIACGRPFQRFSRLATFVHPQRLCSS